LASALEELGVATNIIALRERGSRTEPMPRNEPVTWIDCLHRYLPLGWTKELRRTLRKAVEEQEHTVIHDAGIWLPSNRQVAQVSAEVAAPRVVSPRGMLSAWALGQGRLRKKLAWRLHQRRDLERASLLHATAEAEAEDFRRAGLRNPIAVVPNGVDVAHTISRTMREPRGPRTALFLSRLHRKKGLLDLVEAWRVVRPSGWRLVIAGEDEGGYRRTIETAAAMAGLGQTVDFSGPVDDDKKWELYASADLFVLPSYSENFGLVVAEALASGVPVVTTKATPWPELETARCGWWIDTGAVALSAALREATAATDEQRRAMGERGRDLIEKKYSWKQAAAQMLACYQWLLQIGRRPECILAEA
jgi:glycosyltransferase involved in cell wall biosynthesis